MADFATAMQRVPGAHERLLDRVLGCRLAHDRSAVGEQRRAVSLEDHVKSALVARLHHGHEVRVALGPGDHPPSVIAGGRFEQGFVAAAARSHANELSPPRPRRRRALRIASRPHRRISNTSPGARGPDWTSVRVRVAKSVVYPSQVAHGSPPQEGQPEVPTHATGAGCPRARHAAPRCLPSLPQAARCRRVTRCPG